MEQARRGLRDFGAGAAGTILGSAAGPLGMGIGYFGVGHVMNTWDKAHPMGAKYKSSTDEFKDAWSSIGTSWNKNLPQLGKDLGGAFNKGITQPVQNTAHYTMTFNFKDAVMTNENMVKKTIQQAIEAFKRSQHDLQQNMQKFSNQGNSREIQFNINNGSNLSTMG